MRTVTIDDVVWHVALTGQSPTGAAGQVRADVEQAGVRFSRHGETRTRMAYVSADVPFEEVPDMALTVAFDEGVWEDEAAREA